MFEFQYCGVQNSHTLKWLKTSNCDPQVINDIERTMTVGCPNIMNATYINMMLFHNSKPKIIYGTAFLRHLETIWNFRIKHPISDILLLMMI